MNACVSGNLVGRFENGSGAMVETLVRMQTALESVGVVFIPQNRRSWGSASRGSSRKGQTQPFRRTKENEFPLPRFRG
jgi:hypothetical protein